MPANTPDPANADEALREVALDLQDLHLEHISRLGPFHEHRAGQAVDGVERQGPQVIQSRTRTEPPSVGFEALEDDGCAGPDGERGGKAVVEPEVVGTAELVNLMRPPQEHVPSLSSAGVAS